MGTRAQARLVRDGSREALVEMQDDLSRARLNRDDVKAQLRRQIEAKLNKHPDRELFELFLALGA